MTYQVKDIVYENGPVWVLCNKARQCYTVYISGVTHSTSDSSYALNEDGKSIAIARANYLVKRHTEKMKNEQKTNSEIQSAKLA